VGLYEGVFAAMDERALAKGERGVKRREEFEKTGRQVASGVKVRGGGINRHNAVRKG
jgi:hypothetical protein